ncbi:MAG TPA: PEP-CTERM sorting domain-containing protein [Tepidisphaeraceae bacterium]|jgi:hypothetical protein|nr:PEP-CTERM sorting domain-containing protein [Tepidisphaeraceae bacterium]
MNRSSFRLAAAAVVVFGSAVAAQADVIVGVQFPQTYGNNPPGTNTTVDDLNGGGGNGYTAGVVQQEYWNVANVFDNAGPGTGNTQPITNADLISSGGTPVSPTLLTSTGGTSSVQFSFANISANDHTDASNVFPSPIWYSPGGTADAYLAQGVDFNSSSGTPTLSFSGLNPTDNYNLIAYVGSAWYTSPANVTITMGTTTYYLTTDHNNGPPNYLDNLTTWTPSSSTNSAVSPVADYVEFSNVPGAVLGLESLTVNGSDAGLSGFQLDDTGGLALPEPASLGLLAFAGLGLLRRRPRST